KVRWNPPPVPQYGFWAMVGTSLGGVAVATTFSLLVLERSNRYAAELSQPVASGTVLTRIAREVDLFSTGANIAWSLTSMVAIATVVTAFFTDWGDDAALVPVLGSTPGAAAM